MALKLDSDERMKHLLSTVTFREEAITSDIAEDMSAVNEREVKSTARAARL
jgi:hypothetical protein